MVIKPMIIFQPRLIWDSHFLILFKNKISFLNQNNTLNYLQNQIALSVFLTLPHSLFLPPQRSHFLFSGDDTDIYLNIQNGPWLSLLSLCNWGTTHIIECTKLKLRTQWNFTLVNIYMHSIYYIWFFSFKIIHWCHFAYVLFVFFFNWCVEFLYMNI